MSTYNPDCELCDGTGVSTGYACQMPAHPCPRCTMPRPDPDAAPAHAVGQQDAPADPMDWPLPCDVTVGAGTIKAGCKLRTLVARMHVMHDMIREGWSSGVPSPAPEVSTARDIIRRFVKATAWKDIDREVLNTVRMAAIDFIASPQEQSSVRDTVLEEAAKVADATEFEGTYCTIEDCKAAGIAIRALKAAKGASNG